MRQSCHLELYQDRVARLSESRSVMSLQGSTISTLLCSIFLGDLERTHLLPLLSEQPHGHCVEAATRCTPGITDLAQAAGCTPSDANDGSCISFPASPNVTLQVLEVCMLMGIVKAASALAWL